MAYLNETSSVKTIVPGAEVSGFCDVVARQKINEVSGEVPQLSGGEGIGISTVDGKTVITNNISAGSNISLVYDMETNTYRIDSTGGSVEGQYVPLSATNCGIGYDSNASNGNSFAQGTSSFATLNSFSQGQSITSFLDSFSQGERNESHEAGFSQGINNTAICRSFAQGNINSAYFYSFAQGKDNSSCNCSLSQGDMNFASGFSIAQGYHNRALNYSQAFGIGNVVENYGLAIGKFNQNSTASFVIGNGTELSSRSDCFVIYNDGSVSAAGKISANGVELGAGGGNTFPITGTNGTTAYTYGADCSSFYLSNTVGRAGSVVTFLNNALNFAAYPSTDVSASWYNIINGANNRSNCYCIRFTNDLSSVSLEDYSAYDKVTVVHSNQYKPNCVLHWNGYTKVFPSGVYCEMVKGTNDQNQTDWFFTNSGRINNLEWD